MLGAIFFMACSKHEAMAIYVVKQACGNDIMACVYLVGFYKSLLLTIGLVWQKSIPASLNPSATTAQICNG